MRPLFAALLSLALWSCSSAPSRSPESALGFVVPDLEHPKQAVRGAEELEEIQVEAQVSGDARRGLWASRFLAELHLQALDRPFLTEPGPEYGSLSGTAHRVAAIEQLAHARVLADELLAGEGANATVPAECAHFAPEGYPGLAQCLDATSAGLYGRLGFDAAAGELLTDVTGLDDPLALAARLDGLAVARPVRPDLCALLARRARATDELAAYRFAIVALESEERLGAPLAPAEAAELEAWILGGASVRFICPRSQTDFVPGLDRSPVSGTPHLEYEAVPRD